MTNMNNIISCCAAQGAKANTAYIYGTAAVTAADGKNLDPSYLFRCNPWSQGIHSRYKFMVKLPLMMFKLLLTNLINPISCCAAQGAKASTADIFGTAADGKNLD
jgi:hypothetical protein